MARRRSPSLLLAGLAVLAIVGFGVRLAETERRIAIDKAENANLTAVRLLSEQIFGVFRTSDALLQSSIRPIAGPPVDFGRFDIDDARELIRIFPEVGYLFLVDGAGKPVAATYDQPFPTANYADRPLFQSHLDGTDFSISPSTISRRTGHAVVPVSRAIRDRYGRLQGVLVCVLERTYLEHLLASLADGQIDGVAVFRTDGTPLARWPATGGDGLTLPAEVIRRLDDQHPVSGLVTASADGRDRLSAFAKVNGYPLVVVVSRGKAVVLAGWWRSTLQMGAVSLAFSIVLLGLAVLDRNRGRQLQESRQTLELITETVAEVFWVGGIEQPSITYLSPAFEKIWRRPRALPNGSAQAFAETVHEEDRRRVVGDLALCRKGRPFEHEFRIRRPDGSIRWIWGRGFPIKDARGGVEHMVGVMQDITERRQAEDDLKRAKQFLDKVVNAAPDPIFVKDRDHRWQVLNDAFCALVGVEREKMLLKTDFDICSPAEAEVFRQMDEKAFASNGENISEEIFTDQTGRAHNLVTKKSAFTDIDGNQYLVGTTRDITAAKQAESALHEARRAAEQANRAKSEFLANMSHEIRTPMTAILGLARLLEEAGLGQQEGDYVRQIRGSAQLLLGILNDILDVSRIEAGRLDLECTEFSLPEVIATIVDIVSLSAREKNLAVTSAIEDRVPPMVVGDPLRLKQILLNLMGNAVKFTEVGEVDLRLAVEEESAEGIMLRFSIRDTGIGIAAERRDHLFQAFTQGDSSTSRRFGGSGLGLAIASKLVTLMGGKMDLSSQPGAGSEFRFTARFARATGKAEPPAEPLHAAPLAGRLAGLRLLLVEDNEVNQAVARQILLRAGALVETADDGAAAVTILAKRAKDFDAVLMDIQMPGMDGYQATRTIRQELGLTALPIIAMTANALASDRRKALAAGMNAHLAKPIDIEALFRTLGANRSA